MKKFRFLTLVLAFILAFSIIAPISAYAAEGDTSGPNTGRTLANNDGKIIFNPNSSVEEGATFDIYQVLILESYDKTTGKYSYKYKEHTEESNQWSAFFTGNGAGLNYMTVNDDGYVEWKAGVESNDANTQKLAGDIRQYIIDNNISPSQATKTYNNAPIEWTGLPLGYYLVVSSAGILCNLTTTNNVVTIDEKNTAKIEKAISKIPATGTLNYTDDVDAQIGEDLMFKITVYIYAGAKNYVVHDDMSAGLTFDPATIKLAAEEGGVAITSDHYTIVTEANDTENELCGLSNDRTGCEFHVHFKDEYLDDVSDKLVASGEDYQTVEITYKAALNKNAVVHQNIDGYTIPNINEAKLSFGDNHSTSWDKVTVDTFMFSIVKYDGTSKALLDGATFKLYGSDGIIPIAVVKLSDDYYRIAGSGDAAGDIKDSIEVKNGSVIIAGLDSSKIYYIEEIVAPAGYNILKTKETVVLPTSNNLFLDTNSNNMYDVGEGGVAIANHGGAILPSTGGTGTVIFITVGSLIALAAFVILVARKRSSGYAI